MERIPTIALVGDHDGRIAAHVAIPLALEAARLATGTEVAWRWLGSDAVTPSALAQFDGFWLTPGSPYRSMDGALAVARFAREQGIPFFGSCGGFQHALIELARNAAGLAGADHAETNPTGDTAVISPLACGLVEVAETVRFEPGSRFQAAYGTNEAREGYHCRFGLNEIYREVLQRAGFWFTAFGEGGLVRGGELRGHPFFAGTLFQPERRALRGEPVPLAGALVSAVGQRKVRTKG
jgi:CTP synthase (UTP-ammonia lyase)